MKQGIYSMFWKDSPHIKYIGLSTNINLRIKTHMRALQTHTHQNYKLNEAYYLYGVLPEVEILEEIDYIEDLADAEIYFISVFDSINLGYNIAKGGAGNIFHPKKEEYTKEILIKVLKLLANKKRTYKDIKEETDIPIKTLKAIGAGEVYMELAEYSITLYSSMLYTCKKREEYIHIKPSNYKVSTSALCIKKGGVREFCRQHTSIDPNEIYRAVAVGIVPYTTKDTQWTITKISKYA